MIQNYLERLGAAGKPVTQLTSDHATGINVLNHEMQEALNRQINAELFSSYLYLSMSAWLDAQGLKGMAHWMRTQAQEETLHALKFIDFVSERDGRVLLTSIDAPQTEWKSPLAVFEHTCEHEAHVTALIGQLVDQAVHTKDHAANGFLQWFVTEQVEEEATVRDIRDKLKMIGDTGAMLYMIDQELGQRTLPVADQSGA